MTFNTGHVYSCKWQFESDYTFFNVLYAATKKGVRGRCLGESFQSGQFKPYDDDEKCGWTYYSWNDPNNTIVDLGPYEAFYSNNPELFV